MIEIDTCCRYCLTIDLPHNLISPCLCDGTSKYVHKNCLLTWLESRRNGAILPIYNRNLLKCEICQYNYNTIITHKDRNIKLYCILFYQYMKNLLLLTFGIAFVSFISVNIGTHSNKWFINGEDEIYYSICNISILYQFFVSILWCKQI
jgi:E3 ubiquitin-protein ligase DOA10